MATIQEEILESFFRKLEDADEFDEGRITRLKELFHSGTKPKAADISAALAEDTSEVAK